MSAPLPPSNDHTALVAATVQRLKSEGLFDKFRRECLADVDTKPAYLNLKERSESYVSRYLERQHWTPDADRIQMREALRKNLLDTEMLQIGVERIVEQVVNPRISTEFKPQVERLVCEFNNVDYNKWRQQRHTTTMPPPSFNKPPPLPTGLPPQMPQPPPPAFHPPPPPPPPQVILVHCVSRQKWLIVFDFHAYLLCKGFAIS